MAAHEADLSGRIFDVLRRVLGLSSAGGESLPNIPMIDLSAKDKKQVHFIGAVGEIALPDSQLFTVPPEKSGPTLFCLAGLWKELRLNQHSRAKYALLNRGRGDSALVGPFGSVILLLMQAAKGRLVTLSIKSPTGVFVVVLSGNAYITQASHCNALAAASGAVFCSDGDVLVEVEGPTSLIIAYASHDQTAQGRSWAKTKERSLGKLHGQFITAMESAGEELSAMIRSLQKSEYFQRVYYGQAKIIAKRFRKKS